jgi:molybdopterin-biosynthesis enzyme MoeA-like protein
MSDANRRQAVRPESSLPLRNGVGTAPGLWHEIDGTAVILLPGVPAELRWMFEHEVRPRLAAYLVASDSHTRRLRTTGVAEARLAEIVRDALGADHHDGLAWCVASYGVDVLVRDDDTARLDDVTGRLRTALGEHLFAEGLLLHLLAEVLDDFVVHVGFEQRGADVVHRLVDVGLADAAPARDLLQGRLETIGEVAEHGWCFPLMRRSAARGSSLDRSVV